MKSGFVHHKNPRGQGKRFARLPLYLMLAPFLVLFFLFTVLPILSSAVLSFFNYDTVNLPRFCGLDNFARMLVDDDVFPKTVSNTLIFAAVTGPAGFALSFVLAWFINDFSPFFRSVMSFLFYAPALTGNGFFIWQVAFSGDRYGYINSFLLSGGIITEPITWLKEEAWVLPIIMMVQLWLSLGVSFLANIAGLQDINPELYESGAIDGIKNRWQEIWYITLPSMRSMLLFGAVMQIQASFSVSYIATALAGYPSVNHAADTIVSHLTDVGTTRYEMGYAAAISIFLFALMAVTRILVGKILDMTGKQS